MNSKTRLETAWSFAEPDRVQIELRIAPAIYEMDETADIVEFIATQADNFYGTGAVSWGFCGL